MANFNIVISATDKATATVKKIDDGISKMMRPYNELGKSFKSLGRGLGFDKIGKDLTNMGRTGMDAARSIGSIARPLAAITSIGSVAGIAALSTEWANLGRNIKNSAANIGMSTSQLQSFQGGAKLAGVSSEAMTSSLQGLGNTMEDAQYGRNQSALMLLNRMGVGLKKTAEGNWDVGGEMKAIADVISKKKNPQTQQLIADQLGMGGLLPFLRQGSAGIEKYEASVKHFGYVMDDSAIKKADEFKQSLSNLDVATDGLKNSVGSALIPAIKPLVDGLAEWIAKNRELIASKIGDWARDFAGWVQGINWKAAGDTATAFITDVGRLFDALGGVKGILIEIAAFKSLSLVGNVAGSLYRIGMLVKALGGLKTAAGAAAAAETAAAAEGAAAAGSGGVAAGAGAAGATGAGGGLAAPVAMAAAVGIGGGLLADKYLLKNDNGTENAAGSAIGSIGLRIGQMTFIPGAGDAASAASKGADEGDYFDSAAGKAARQKQREDLEKKYQAKWGHAYNAQVSGAPVAPKSDKDADSKGSDSDAARADLVGPAFDLLSKVIHVGTEKIKSVLENGAAAIGTGIGVLSDRLMLKALGASGNQAAGDAPPQIGVSNTPVQATMPQAVAPSGVGLTSPSPMTGSAMANGQDVATFFEKQGWTRNQAAGIAANLGAESSFNPNAVGDRGAAYGLGQWHPDRQRDFAQWAGHGIQGSSRDEQLKFVQYELTQGKERRAGDLLRGTNTAEEAGASISRNYERPAAVLEAALSRGANAMAIAGNNSLRAPSGPYASTTAAASQPSKVHVEVSLPSAPPGTKAKVTTDGRATASAKIGYSAVGSVA